MAGLCLRGRGRPARDAQIRHGRPPRLLRRRPQVAGALRVRRAVGAHAERRRFGMKRSEEHTSELQSLMRISYAVCCLKKKKPPTITPSPPQDMTHQTYTKRHIK